MPEKNITFQEICDDHLKMPVLQASYLLDGLAEYPDFGYDLFVDCSPKMANWRFTASDAETFIKRVKDYQNKGGGRTC